MLSLAHLREFKAEQANKGLGTVTEREVSPSPISSSQGSTDGVDDQSHQDVTSSKSEDVGNILQEPEPSGTPMKLLPVWQHTKEDILVPNKLISAKLRPSDHGNRIKSARSRLCRSMGVELNDTYVTCSMAALLKAITSLRLRNIPHQGSPLDRYLKQAERTARTIGAYVHLLGDFDESVRLGGLTVWGCCELMLKCDVSRMHVVGKVLSSFDQAGLILQRMISDCNQESNSFLEDLSDALIRTVEMYCEVTWSLRSFEKASSTQFLMDMDAKLEVYLQALRHSRSRLKHQLWQVALDDPNKPIDFNLPHHDFISIKRMWTWLGASNAESGMDLWSFDTAPEEHDSQDWLVSTINSFYASGKNILQIYGPIGCGKSKLFGRLARLVEHRKQKDAKLLCFRNGAQMSTQNCSLTLVKNLLVQLLDEPIKDFALYCSLCKAYKNSKEKTGYSLESDLWTILDHTLATRSQQNIIIIDGLDQIEGGFKAATSVRDRLHKMAIQKHSLRCILLVRPGLDSLHRGVFDIALDARFIAEEIRQFLEGEVKQSFAFARFSAHEREIIIRRILDANFGSCLEVRMLLSCLDLEDSYPGVLSKLSKTPRSLSSMIDSLILKLDFRQSTFSLMAWLLVGQRLCTITELEQLTGHEYHNTLIPATGSSSKRAPSCNSLVEMKRGKVQFIHPLIRDRLQELASRGKVALTTVAAHRCVAMESLAYIKSRLPADPEITFYPSPKAELSASEKLNEDPLFVHCVSSYIDHYDQSDLPKREGSRTVCPPVLMDVFPDSVSLALAEYTFWQSTKDHRSLERLLVRAIELRRFAFGKRSRSLAQSIASLARVRIDVGSDSEGFRTLMEAWDLTKDIYDENSPVRRECAEVYSATLRICRKRSDLQVPRDAERIVKYLWERLRLELGEVDPKVLQLGKDLAELYIETQRLEQAETIIRTLHRACLGAWGVSDERTADLAEALIEVLEQLSGQDEEVRRLRESLSDTSIGTIALWHPRRVKTVLCLVDFYERRQLLSLAEQRLRDYLEQLDNTQGQEGAGMSLFIGISDVTLRLGQLLASKNQTQEAIEAFVAYWRRYEEDLPLNGELELVGSALSRFRLVAEELIRLGASYKAKEILMRLRAWHFEDIHGVNDELLRVSLALARCLRLSPCGDDAEKVLKDLYDTLFNGNRRSDKLDGGELTICIDLASLYKSSGRIATAIDVCLQVLNIKWPSILDQAPSNTNAATSQSRETIHIVALLAGYYKASGQVDRAEALSRGLRRAIFARIFVREGTSTDEADWFSHLYESLGLTDDALLFWQELHSKCTTERFSNSTFSRWVAFQLARLYRKLDRTETEGILIGIIDDLGHEHSHECSKSRFETIMTLCELYEKQHNYNELRKWYLTLWSSFLNQRDGNGVSGKQGLEIFNNYVTVLVHFGDTLGAIRVARELRAVLLAEFGASDSVSLKAALELAALLEKDAGGRQEAVSILEEICKFSTEEASTDQQFHILIRSARDRLAHLLTTQPDLAHRAELIFMQDWDEATKIFGYSSKETLASLTHLIAFYRKHYGRKYTEMALKKIEVTVRGIITQEKDLQKLFNSAQAIAKHYIELNAHERAFTLLDRIRGDGSGQNGIGFLSDGGWVDRRWMTFAATLEATLREKVSPTLFADIAKDLFIETSLHESWLRVLQSEATLETRLSVGGQLLAFLKQKYRQLEISHITDELWEVFRSELSPESPKAGAIWQLFQVCVTEMSHERLPVSFLETAVRVVLGFCQAAKYQQALELARWIKEHVQGRGGFQRPVLSSLGVRLSTCLIDVSVLDLGMEIVEAMQRLSTEILMEVFLNAESVDVDLSSMTIKQINVLINLLASKQDYKAIERILENLWSSRTSQSWSISTTISIGRRFCEVKFALQKHKAALSLLEDICYNLHDVLGPLHSITIECDRLRARLNKQCGNHEAAMDIHAQVLQKVTALGADCSLSKDEVATVGMDELRSLRAVYWMCGGWGKRSGDKFAELSRELVDVVGVMDEEAEKIADVSSWRLEAKTPVAQYEGGSGREPPTDFAIEDEEEGIPDSSRA